MPYHYNDPKRENEPTAFPNVEVFFNDEDSGQWGCEPRNFGSDGYPIESGWYYAFGFPGCLWDSDPVGPFDTEAEALADAREGFED